jgi:hypothetical protein
MSWKFWFILILIVWYISWYYRYPNLTILQSGLEKFQFSLLLEKQPIIIHDRIRDLQELLKAWFNTNKQEHHLLGVSPSNQPVWHTNPYKYTLIHPTQDIEVALCSAKVKLEENIPPEKETLVIIKLKANMILILPLHIHYALLGTGTDVPVVGIHDYITRWLPSFRNTNGAIQTTNQTE